MVSPIEVDDEASGMLITAVDVVDEPTDYGQFTPLLEQAEETTGARACLTLADAGYYSGSNRSECAGRGPAVAMPETSPRQSRGHPYHKDRFANDESSDGFRCPQEKALPFDRIRIPPMESITGFTGRPEPSAERAPPLVCARRARMAATQPLGRTTRRCGATALGWPPRQLKRRTS